MHKGMLKSSRPGSFPQNLTKLLAGGGEELLVILKTFQHSFILQINKTLSNGKKEFLNLTKLFHLKTRVLMLLLYSQQYNME